MDGVEYRLTRRGSTMDEYEIVSNPDGLDAAALARIIDPYCFGFMGDGRHVTVFKD